VKYDRVLVTGGSGFIGSHTVDALLQENVETLVLDDLSTGAYVNLAGHKGDRLLHVVKGTVSNPKTVTKLTARVDAVIHLAAIVSPMVSVLRPEVTNDVNVRGTLNVLQAALKSKVPRLVFASSSSVYGDTGSPRQIDELTLTNPINPYGVSKLAGEKYCAAFYTTYDLDTISLRYFNVYGERQKHNPYSGVIAIFANAMLRNRRVFIDGDGRQTRDFVHVTDVARANLAALECQSGRGEAFNIGTGMPTSINTLFRLVARSSRRHGARPIHRSLRVGDIRNSCANVSNASRLLKFRPRIELKEGVTRLLDWLRLMQQ
jgi:UDP-glucose 4-epimerase